MRFSIRLLLVALLLQGAQAQQVDRQLVLSAGAPPAPTTVTGIPTGPGGQPLFYWVIARYPIGTSSPSQTARVNNTAGEGNLSASNSVIVNWTPMPGATGYDVIRSATVAFPAPCAACAVVLNTAGTSFSDIGGATFAYPPAGVTQQGEVTGQITINNRDETTPTTRYNLAGEDMRISPLVGSFVAGNLPEFDATGRLVDSGSAAPSGGPAIAGPLTTVGSVPFVIAANQLGEDNANLFWDNTNKRLGIGTAVPGSTLDVSAASGATLSLDSAASTATLDIDSGGGSVARLRLLETGSVRWLMASDGGDADKLKITPGSVLSSSTVTALRTNPIGVGFGNIDPTGTLDILDRTAATGATLMQVGQDGTNTSAVSTLLSVTAGATQGAVNLQEWQNNAGTALTFILANGTLGLVDTLFAALGTPADGTFTYCSDCTIASPCAGGGTGALAKRLNGTWVCN